MTEKANSSLLSEIVRRCKEGDRSSFRELYDTYKDRIYTTSFRLLGNSEDAEDAAQEIFIKVFRSIRNFRGDSSLHTWIYRITVNTCIEHIRKRKKEVQHESLDELEGQTPVPVSTDNPVTVRLIVEREIEHLPEGCKTVFVLHTIEGFKHNEIAEILNITTGTSKSQLAAAKARLRKQLLPYMEVLKNEL